MQTYQPVSGLAVWYGNTYDLEKCRMTLIGDSSRITKSAENSHSSEGGGKSSSSTTSLEGTVNQANMWCEANLSTQGNWKCTETTTTDSGSSTRSFTGNLWKAQASLEGSVAYGKGTITPTRRIYTSNTNADGRTSTSSTENVLTKEYTTEEFVQNVINDMPDYPSEWPVYWDGYGYKDTWYGRSMAWRSLNKTEDFFELCKAKYRYKIGPSAASSLRWMEIFVPEDDPTTADIDESKKIEILRERTWKFSEGETESPEFEIDPTTEQRGNGFYIVNQLVEIEADCNQIPGTGSFGQSIIKFPYLASDSDLGAPEAAPPEGPKGKSLQIFFKYVKDSNDKPIDFDINLKAIVHSGLENNFSPITWSLTSKSSVATYDTGGLDKNNKFEVKYKNPTTGGLYQFNFRSKFNETSLVNVLLPIAGGQIDDWLLAEVSRAVARAYDWELTVRQVAMDHGIDSDDFMHTAWKAIATYDFDYQGVAYETRTPPTARYSYTDADQPDPNKKGNGDWDEPSYCTLRELVVARAKINNLFYAVWGRELGYSTFALKAGAYYNAIRDAEWDDASSQNSIQLGSDLYDAHYSMGNLALVLTKPAVKLMQTPDVLNDLNLWPNKNVATSNFLFPEMPTGYDSLKNGEGQGIRSLIRGRKTP
jgi:hypothetical protein